MLLRVRGRRGDRGRDEVQGLIVGMGVEGCYTIGKKERGGGYG